jgi:hypothetical protein
MEFAWLALITVLFTVTLALVAGCGRLSVKK